MSKDIRAMTKGQPTMSERDALFRTLNDFVTGPDFLAALRTATHEAHHGRRYYVVLTPDHYRLHSSAVPPEDEYALCVPFVDVGDDRTPEQVESAVRAQATDAATRLYAELLDLVVHRWAPFRSPRPCPSDTQRL